jgi:hypothetical protein
MTGRQPAGRGLGITHNHVEDPIIGEVIDDEL